MSKYIYAFLSRFMPDRYSIGIEMTDLAVKAVEMELNTRRFPHVLQYGTEPLPTGCVDDGKILEPYKLIQSIQTLLARMNVRSKRVHLVVPSQSIMVRFLKFPDIPLKDLKKLIDFEVKHNIHLPFENPVYDFVKLNGSEETGQAKRLQPPKPAVKEEPDPLGLREAAPSSEGGFDLRGSGLFGESRADEEGASEPVPCDVMLVAAPRELIDEYLQVATSAGLKPISIEFKALSLYRVIKKTKCVDPKATFLAVDINEKMSDLSIFHNGSLKITRTVPLLFEQKSDSEQAPKEEELLSFLAINDKDAEFRSTCSDLAHELERLMNFYRYTLNHRHQEFERVVLSGDVVRLHDIAEFLSDRLNMEVKVIYSPNIKVNNEFFEHTFPTLAVPIGLALRGRES